MSGKSKGKPNLKTLLGDFVLELVIYSVLIVAYFVLALRLLAEPLTSLFHSSLIAYAVLALVLIAGQGLLLERFTSFLLDYVRLDRLK